MPVLTKALSAFFCKVEATEGTDAVPAAGDAVQLIEHPTMTWGQEIQNPQTDLENQLLDEGFPLPPAGKWAEITIKNWIRGAGSAYNGSTIFPELHAVLQAMGLSAAFVTSHEDYDTASTGTKSVTCYAFRETDTGAWVKYAILGARCSRALFTFQAGKPVELEATFRGLFVQPSDGSFITPTYQTTSPPIVGAAASWTLGALSPLLRKATLELQLPLVPQLSVNAVDAIAGYKPVKRKMIFTAEFEGARISDYDAFTAWKNAPNNALAIAVGTGANNKLTVTADKATIFEAPAYQDDQGLWLHRVSGLLTPEGANRCKFSFTA
jgi:hypothetical protein